MSNLWLKPHRFNVRRLRRWDISLMKRLRNCNKRSMLMWEHSLRQKIRSKSICSLRSLWRRSKGCRLVAHRSSQQRLLKIKSHWTSKVCKQSRSLRVMKRSISLSLKSKWLTHRRRNLQSSNREITILTMWVSHDRSSWRWSRTLRMKTSLSLLT